MSAAFALVAALCAAPAASTTAPITSVAVLPLQSTGKLNRDTVSVLDALLLSALDSALGKQLRVIGKSDIDAMLGLEKTKDALGCSEVGCAVELAGALGVDSIISGSLGKLGKKTMLSLSWIDHRQATPLARHSRDLGASEDEFDAGVRAAVAALTGGVDRHTAPASPSGSDVSGLWRWDCCGRAYEGWLLLRQEGATVRGLFTDLKAGSGGNLEGRLDGNRLRLVRRVPALKLVQQFNLDLASDGTSASGDIDGGALISMQRASNRPTGTRAEGITGTWRWECCQGAYRGQALWVQEGEAVFGLFDDEVAGSGGYLEGTLTQKGLEFTRVWGNGTKQTFTMQRGPNGFSGQIADAQGRPAGLVTMSR